MSCWLFYQRLRDIQLAITIRVKAGVGNIGETGEGKLDFESIQQGKSLHSHSSLMH